MLTASFRHANLQLAQNQMQFAWMITVEGVTQDGLLEEMKFFAKDIELLYLKIVPLSENAYASYS